GEPNLGSGPPLSLPGIGKATLYSGSTGLPRFNVPGGAAYGLLGAAVAGVGDQNGDGYADVLVGRPGYGSAFSPPGQATIYSGLEGSALGRLVGAGRLERFGFAVSEVGDLDADGAPDVIVGAPQASPGDSPTRARRASFRPRPGRFSSPSPGPGPGISSD